MEIQILAFGIAKDIFGSSMITANLPEHANTNELKLLLETQYPRLKQLASYMLAVNNEYVTTPKELLISDEIAVIPPVSGG